MEEKSVGQNASRIVANLTLFSTSAGSRIKAKSSNATLKTVTTSAVCE